jgi:hypothetical protein
MDKNTTATIAISVILTLVLIGFSGAIEALKNQTTALQDSREAMMEILICQEKQLQSITNINHYEPCLTDAHGNPIK